MVPRTQKAPTSFLTAFRTDRLCTMIAMPRLHAKVYRNRLHFLPCGRSGSLVHGPVSLESLYMLLDFILSELDGELDRLGRLRSIVAGIGRVPTAVVAVPPPPPAVVEATPPRRRGRQRRYPAKSSPRRRVHRPKAPPEPLTALTNAIPSGPIVVLPAQLARERVARQATVSPLPIPEGALPAIDPEVLLRELSARWGTGAVAGFGVAARSDTAGLHHRV